MKKTNYPAILLITGVILFSISYLATLLVILLPLSSYPEKILVQLSFTLSISTILIPLGLLLLCCQPKGKKPTYKLLGVIGSTLLMLCGIAKLCLIGVAMLQQSGFTVDTLITFHQTLSLFYTLSGFILFIALCAYLLFELKKTPQTGSIKTYLLINLLTIAFIAWAIFTNASLISSLLQDFFFSNSIRASVDMFLIMALAGLVFFLFLLCAIALACFTALDQQKLYIHAGKTGSLLLLAFLISTGIYIFFISRPSIQVRNDFTQDPIIILLLLLGAIGVITLFVALISTILHITSRQKPTPTSTQTPMDLATNTPPV